MLSVKSSKKQVWAHRAKQISEDSHLGSLEVSSVLENDDHGAVWNCRCRQENQGGRGLVRELVSAVLLILSVYHRTLRGKENLRQTN